MVVYVCKTAERLLPPNPGIDDFKRMIASIGTSWSTQGVTQRMIVVADSEVAGHGSAPAYTPSAGVATATIRPFATIYTHDHPEGYPATKQERDTWLSRITTVIIFIRHELNLPYGYKGDLYLRDGGPSVLDAEVPKLQYSILRHLLRHQATKAKRTLPAIMKACWSNETTAVRQADELQDGTNKPDRKYDTAITKLSKILQSRCSTAVRTAQTGVYELQPPPTYCLIEEGTTSTDT